MASLNIRVGFNQLGITYSVRDNLTGAITPYAPGGTLPGIGVVPTQASTPAMPVRCWLLTDKVSLENSDGTLYAEGFRGDYMIETIGGHLMIVKSRDVRSELDLFGDVSRVYRNTPAEVSVMLEEKVVGRMKNGTEF